MKEKDILNGDYTVWENGQIRVNYKDCINIYELNGYDTISYKNKTLYVHRLIAEAFIPNPNNYPCINHINGNKKDNRIENLEWCTYSHNNKEAYKLGLKKPASQTNKHRSVVMLDDNKNEICVFEKMKYADKLFKVKTSSNIKRAIDTGIKAYGFYWRYL